MAPPVWALILFGLPLLACKLYSRTRTEKVKAMFAKPYYSRTGAPSHREEPGGMESLLSEALPSAIDIEEQKDNC